MQAMTEKNAYVSAVLRCAGVVLLLVAVPAGMWGCGPNDSGEGSSGFDSEVDSDQPVGELSDQEAQQLCRDATRYLFDLQKSSTETVCKLQAHTTVGISDPPPSDDEEAQNRCTETKNACEEQIGNAEFDASNCSEADAETDCDVPVSTVETCLTDSYDRILDKFREAPSCQEVRASYYEDYEHPLVALDSPESCTTLDEKCPDFELPIDGAFSTDTDDESCDEGEYKIKFDRDGDGQKETFCAKSCSEDTDCSGDKTCNQGYCMDLSDSSGGS